MTTQRNTLSIMTIMLVCQLIIAQKVTISGYVEDISSGEKLIGCNEYHYASQSGTVTNTFGFYSITLDKSSYIDLEVSYIGYATKSVSIEGHKSQSVNIKLKGEVVFEEIEITANKDKKIETETQMSTIDVPILQIKKIPALMGETDVLKALQLLPGVQSGGERQAGLYVRGGSPDQNLILLDGVPVYNANHLFGFFSVFNAEAIKDVTLIKGGFPARYGGRLSSVLEINLKDGHQQEFHGDVSIGLVGSKLTLEGPINKGKTSFLVSGRRTYIDVLAKPFIKQSFSDNGSDGDAGYYFYDLNAKINHTFSQKDRIYLSVYGGNDKFYFEQTDAERNENRDFTENGLGWGNVTGALTWNHIIHDKLFMNTTLTYSKYKLNTGVSLGTEFPDKTKDFISSNLVTPDLRSLLTNSATASRIEMNAFLGAKIANDTHASQNTISDLQIQGLDLTKPLSAAVTAKIKSAATWTTRFDPVAGSHYNTAKLPVESTYVDTIAGFMKLDDGTYIDPRLKEDGTYAFPVEIRDYDAANNTITILFNRTKDHLNVKLFEEIQFDPFTNPLTGFTVMHFKQNSSPDELVQSGRMYGNVMPNIIKPQFQSISPIGKDNIWPILHPENPRIAIGVIIALSPKAQLTNGHRIFAMWNDATPQDNHSFVLINSRSAF